MTAPTTPAGGEQLTLPFARPLRSHRKPTPKPTGTKRYTQLELPFLAAPDGTPLTRASPAREGALTPEQQRLASDNMGLVYRAIQNLRIPESWRQDAESDGLLGLIYAARSFDGTSKTKFGTFAYVCIERKMKNTLQRLTNQTKRRVDASESDNGLEQVVDAPEVLGPVQQRVPASYRAFGELAPLVVALPTPMRRVLRLTYVEGLNLRRAALKLGCNSEQVRKLLRGAWHQLAEDLGRADAPRAGKPWTDEDDTVLDRVATIEDRAGRRLALLLAAKRLGRTVAETRARLEGEE